jgi:hypothetical protein
MLPKQMNKPLTELTLYLAGSSMGVLAAAYELPADGSAVVSDWTSCFSNDPFLGHCNSVVAIPDGFLFAAEIHGGSFVRDREHNLVSRIAAEKFHVGLR